MPTSTWNGSVESGDSASAGWIKSNMFGDIYSVELGRSLTDAEIRFQKSLQQLRVPSWYLTYSKKKPSIRQNCIPFDKRPPTWKQVKPQINNNQKKSPKKRSPKSSPKNSDTESRADSGFNETYRITRRTPKSPKSPCISITSSSSDDEPNTPPATPKDTKDKSDKALPINLSLNRTPRHVSFTFPRVTPSRKIEHLNIVFSKPFPPRDGKLELENAETEPQTVRTKTNDDEEPSPRENNTSDAADDETHTTFLIADVDPDGVHPRIHVSATSASSRRTASSSSSSSSSSDEEASNSEERGSPSPKPQPAPRFSPSPKPRLPARCSPSPNTRFFISRKKSTALENIVQRNLDKPRGTLVQDIINELEQSTDDFSRSFLGALKDSVLGEGPEYQAEADGDLESGSDSELGKSVDITINASAGEEELSSDDLQPTTTPLPRVPSAAGAASAASSSPPESPAETPAESPVESSSEEEVYWIPTWMSKIPRTSSRLSVLSRASSGHSRLEARSSSPGLSPIRREHPEDWLLVNPSRAWGYTYSSRRSGRSPRLPLFRIDETGQLDSGYSDTASSRRTAPSRAATAGSRGEKRDKYTPDTSIASSSTLAGRDGAAFNNAAIHNKSGPYVLKSFMV